MSINIPPGAPAIQVEEGPKPASPVAVVDGLVDLLRRERAAIARLDREALEAIAGGSTSLLDELRGYLAPGAKHLSGEDRKSFSDAVRRLVAEAQVNAVLLHDARTVLAQMLGAPTGEGTYNSRGELSRAVRAIVRGQSI